MKSVFDGTLPIQKKKSLVKDYLELDMVMQAFNLSTREAEGETDFCVLGQPGLQSELQDSQDHTEKPCQTEKKERKEGREGGREGGREEGRKEGRKERRKEGKKERRKEGRKSHLEGKFHSLAFF
jgi:flagellar biosynthesis/type III secretory pathway protein FliH